MKTFLIVLTVILLIFLAFGAIYGSWMLISEPSGKNFMWTVELLEGTPFKNFLIPGIVLFIVNGLLPLFITVLVVKNAENYPWFVTFQGCVIIGWLTAEIIFNKDLFSPLMHPLFYFIGILFIGIGWFLKTTKVDSSNQLKV